MTTPQPSLNLTIRLTSDQLGFLTYLYPNDDPEDALIKLLERARNRAICKAEQQVRVLRPDEEGQEISPEEPVSQSSEELVNPIGALQEAANRFATVRI